MRFTLAVGQGEAAATSLAAVFRPDLDPLNSLDVLLNNNIQRKTSTFLCSRMLMFFLLLIDDDILIRQCCKFIEHLASFLWFLLFFVHRQ